MDNTFSATCTSCGNTFKVKIPEGTSQGKKYKISYRCPRCGAQLSEMRSFPEAGNCDGSSSGMGDNSPGGGSRKAGSSSPGSGRTGGSSAGPGGVGGSGLKYIIGIPLVVLALLALAAVISAVSGKSGSASPVLQDISTFRRRVNAFLGSGDVILVGAKLLVLFLCFPAHECAHAWMADKLGDPTGRLRGRITLNPLKHLDVWGTITIFLFGVGYAKPVPVQINNFRHPKRDFALTALAGPVSNLLMSALLLAVIRFLPMIMGARVYGSVVPEILTYAAYINISLAVFNLIPIPPLDGSRVLTAILPDGAYYGLMRYERHMMIALLAALYFLGRAGYSPTANLSGMIFRFLYNLIVVR